MGLIFTAQQTKIGSDSEYQNDLKRIPTILGIYLKRQDEILQEVIVRVTMFNNREQAQYDHIYYLVKQLKVLKSNQREPFLTFFIVGGLIYWGSENAVISIAIAWMGAMIRAVANDLKRTYFLTEHNRAVCDFEGDLDQLKTKLEFTLKIEAEVSKLTRWKL